MTRSLGDFYLKNKGVSCIPGKIIKKYIFFIKII